MKLIPVLLSGGSGTRLWPLSREAYPKQFLPLAGAQTMLQATWARVRDLGGAAPLVVANEEHRFMVAEQLREVGCTPEALILEPVGRNTAPAIAVAALQALAGGEDALLLVLPSDHVIRDEDGFRCRRARRAAGGGAGRTGDLRHRPGRARDRLRLHQGRGRATGVRAVERFVEKPDRATAERYLADGRLLLEQRHVPVPRRPLPRGARAPAAGDAGGLPRGTGQGAGATSISCASTRTPSAPVGPTRSTTR